MEYAVLQQLFYHIDSKKLPTPSQHQLSRKKIESASSDLVQDIFGNLDSIKLVSLMWSPLSMQKIHNF